MDLDNIYHTFIEAFSDYAVSIQMEKEKLFRMMKRRGAVLDYSVGVFEKSKMVAVMITAIDEFRGKRSAYDVFTGVIPSHRGQKLAGTMFELVQPKLIKNGIKQFVLEVLQENEPAIKVYSKTGFEINRSFECYEVEKLPEKINENCYLTVETEFKPAEVGSFRDWVPSWQNSDASMLRTEEELRYLKAYENNKLVGYAVVIPSSGDLPQIAVSPESRQRRIGSRLLFEAGSILSGGKNLRVINIDSNSESDLNFFKRIEAKKITSQYEMILNLDKDITH